jgi:rubrerythrin
MAQLTHKELMLLQDNIKMCQESVQFLQGCMNMVNDPQLKNLCQQMLQDHRDDAQILSGYITNTNIQ